MNSQKNKMATKKMYFEFHIVKWDERGNKLLEKHKKAVQRQTLSSARDVVRKKYPAWAGEKILKYLQNKGSANLPTEKTIDRILGKDGSRKAG